MTPCENGTSAPTNLSFCQKGCVQSLTGGMGTCGFAFLGVLFLMMRLGSAWFRGFAEVVERERQRGRRMERGVIGRLIGGIAGECMWWARSIFVWDWIKCLVPKGCVYTILQRQRSKSGCLAGWIGVMWLTKKNCWYCSWFLRRFSDSRSKIIS